MKDAICSLLSRYKWWWVALLVLLILNIIRFWPAKHPARAFAGGPPDGPGGPPPPGEFREPDQEMLARIDALPEEQRTAIRTRMKEDREFFDSVRNLPEEERRQKMQEHFAQNPPPPGFPSGGPNGGPPPGPPGGGPGGPGGPDDGRAPRIPPPEVRRSMDQGLVNAMKSQANQ